MHLGAWAVATGAAVSLSWFGVHAVLSDSAFDPPRTLTVPLTDGPSGPDASSTRLPLGELGPATARAAEPRETATVPSATPRATVSPSVGRRQSVPQQRPTGGAASPTGQTGQTGQTKPAKPAGGAGADGEVRSISVTGGRVAVEMHPDFAELVSATPDPGWEMEMWAGEQWIRVDFSRDGAANSVFVTWNGHPPTVQTVNR
ncbi:hypothetical protein [Peterkaempfera bronchialis]|uniref:hypothetical protein n=1 Tax=Peterkaempfera bronchialis TaxID=2126346 RepID=UPI003C2FE344